MDAGLSSRCRSLEIVLTSFVSVGSSTISPPPNVLSASGLLMLVYAYNIAFLYFDEYPRLISFACALLITA